MPLPPLLSVFFRTEILEISTEEKLQEEMDTIAAQMAFLANNAGSVWEDLKPVDKTYVPFGSPLIPESYESENKVDERFGIKVENVATSDRIQLTPTKAVSVEEVFKAFDEAEIDLTKVEYRHWDIFERNFDFRFFS